MELVFVEKINAWLQKGGDTTSDAGDYQEGVNLLAQAHKNRTLISNLNRNESETNRAKLVYELGKLVPQQSEEPTGNESDETSDEPTGKEPTGNEPTGNEITGKEPTGKEPTGNESDETSDEPTGDDPDEKKNT